MTMSAFPGRLLVAGLLVLLTMPAATPPVMAAVLDPGWPAGAFLPAAELLEPRAGHTAGLLPDGRVLVVGGERDEGPLASAETWDPLTEAWAATGPLTCQRSRHAMAVLPDGRALVVGGNREACEPDGITSSAEVWDPATGTFAGAGDMSTPRAAPSATLLLDGRILVAGGFQGRGDDDILASLETWDPASATFAPAGSLIEARWKHTATRLADGRVLVVGGQGPRGTVGSAEIWDPATGKTSPAGTLEHVRVGHTASLLPDGRVAVIGGVNGRGIAVRRTEVWDPATAAFSPWGTLDEARAGHTASLTMDSPLGDGRVLVVDGEGGIADPRPLASAELWTATSFEPRPVGGLPIEPRTGHTATNLPDGRILLAGGWGPDGPLASTETWTPTDPEAAVGSEPPRLYESGRLLVSLVDGLRVRSQPSVAEDSLMYDPLLPQRTRLRVLAGPVAGSGYWWYHVELPRGEEALEGAVREGWVASADHDGTPWIGVGRPVDSGRPSERQVAAPAAPVDIQAASFDAWAGIECDPAPCGPIGIRLNWQDARPEGDQAGFRVYLVRYWARWEGNPNAWVEDCDRSRVLASGQTAPRLIAELGSDRRAFRYVEEDWQQMSGRPPTARRSDEWTSTRYQYGRQLLVSAFDSDGDESRRVPSTPVEYLFCGLVDPTP
jgi:hypothetical protein